MSDDIKARLRAFEEDYRIGPVDICLEAADRIDQLELMLQNNTKHMVDANLAKAQLERDNAALVATAELDTLRMKKMERELNDKAAEIERIKQRIAHFTNPQFLRHRGNGIDLNCKRSTIDLFVSRAIENKDMPEPTPEQVASFREQLDAAAAKDKQ